MEAAVLPTHESPSIPSSGTVELEIRLLDRCYAELCVREPQTLARLCGSLSIEGQRHPVLVVQREAGRYALIDGYTRVAALERLARDMVTALVLAIPEADALAYCHRMESAGRRSALEDGWLVAELVVQGRSLREIGVGLDRSGSWVSRRLALSRGLPEKASAAVRRGAITAHGAMGVRFPLAPANKLHCERICEHVQSSRITSRQLEAIYAAWRAGDAEQRERISEAPLLFLKAKGAVTRALPSGPAGTVVKDLDGARAALVRAGECVARMGSIDPSAVSSPPVQHAFGRCTDAYETLVRQMEEPHAE